MERLKFATVWLGGCSGCHMSFLDLDEWLIDLASLVDIVYTPIADVKEYPPQVDIALVEGAVANEDHLRMIKTVRQNTRLLVSFGDCAITGNVTALRNPLGNPTTILQQIYVQGITHTNGIPSEPGIVPALLERVVPLHAVVPIDVYLPGCPPSAARIKAALLQLLEGDLDKPAGREALRFG
jgi:NAD-reducing hydrogenase small subunit